MLVERPWGGRTAADCDTDSVRTVRKQLAEFAPIAADVDPGSVRFLVCSPLALFAQVPHAPPSQQTLESDPRS